MEERSSEVLGFEEDGMQNKFLTFTLEREEYGIDIQHVIEIIGIQTITEIPEMPEFIKGIINLRGKIIPVMDVRIRFKKEACKYNDRTCIIVINNKDLSVGLIIDSVSEVLAIPKREIMPLPQISRDYHHRYIKGIGKVENNVKLLLDCEKLLNNDEAINLYQNN